MYPGTSLYPNELLQSALGRIQSRWGMEFRPFIKQVLGNNHERLRSALDFRCVAIWNSLWPSLKEEALLRNHTLAPMFTWRKTFTHQKAKEIDIGLGKPVSLFIPTGFKRARYKFCYKCWEEQGLKDGEQHWLALWQVPGVNICPRHMIPLDETELLLNAWNVPKEYGYVTPDIVKLVNPLETGKHSKMIADTASDLLTRAPFHAVTITQWMGYLCWLLGRPNMGLRDQMRLLQSRQIIKMLKEYWDPDFMKLDGWEYPLGNLKDEKWWGWLKLLKAIAPKKKLVDGLWECIVLYLNGKLRIVDDCGQES